MLTPTGSQKQCKTNLPIAAFLHYLANYAAVSISASCIIEQATRRAGRSLREVGRQYYMQSPLAGVLLAAFSVIPGMPKVAFKVWERAIYCNPMASYVREMERGAMLNPSRIFSCL